MSLFAAMLALILITGGSLSFGGGLAAQPFDPNTDSQAPLGVNAENSVAVGGGNATLQYYAFNPATIEINAGDSVTWYSPTALNELHTVTFVRNQSLMSDIILPFSLEESPSAAAGNLETLPPFNLGEPLILDVQGSIAVVALNKLSFYPSVTDSSGQVTQYFNGTDVQYQMNGSEGALNSGIIQQPLQGSELPPGDILAGPSPPGQGGPLFPFVNSFTVTFAEAGTYNYFCALHPWMTGKVIVGDSATAEESRSSASDLDDDRSIFDDLVAPTPSEDDDEDNGQTTDDSGSTNDNEQSESDAIREEEEEKDDNGGCDPSYPDACIESPPPDLDCDDVSEENFEVREPDPHGFDNDGDGVGCES